MPPLWISSKKFLVFLLAAVLWTGPVWAGTQAGKPEVPKPQGWVNDFSNTLSGEWKARMTEISVSLEKATGAELVYLIMPSIAPYDEFTYGMAVFDQWRIGKQGKDNGILILLALKERRIRIQTGYGVEGVLPDGKVGRYRDQYLVPELKAGRMGEGLTMLGTVIAQDLAKAAGVQLSGAAARRVPHKKDGFPYGTLVMVVIMVILSLVSRMGKRRGRGRYVNGVFIPGGYYGSGGGGFGGGFGGFGGGFSGGGGVSGSW